MSTETRDEIISKMKAGTYVIENHQRGIAGEQLHLDMLKIALDAIDKEKPVHHGDFGLNKDKQPGLVVVSGGEIRVACDKYVFTSESANQNAFRPRPVIGNIFELLKQAGPGGCIIALTKDEAISHLRRYCGSGEMLDQKIKASLGKQ